jgi:hypothetical protein
MDVIQLRDHARTIQLAIGAATRADVEKAVDQLVEAGAWDLVGALLLTASELASRVMVAKALENGVYAPLAAAACMRRQQKPPAMHRRGGAAKRVFMDIDAETAQAGVPEYIQAEQEDLSALAAESRDIAARREALRDADPVRHLIVNELAKVMLKSPEALDALVVTVKSSAFEETRRSAALKIINSPVALKRLAEAGRAEDLAQIGSCCRLPSAGEKVAELLTPHVEALIAAKSAEGLDILARYHSDPAVREKATRALQGL